MRPESALLVGKTLRERSLMSGDLCPRARDEGPLGEMYFLRESPAGNGRVNIYESDNVMGG